MIDTIARRAAARLGPSLDPNLPASLERAIANEGRTDRQRSFDAGVSLALAAFLLNAVQFGWKIYRDLKDDRKSKRSRRRFRSYRKLSLRSFGTGFWRRTGRGGSDTTLPYRRIAALMEDGNDHGHLAFQQKIDRIGEFIEKPATHGPADRGKLQRSFRNSMDQFE